MLNQQTESLGQQLRAARYARKMTLRELAERSGVHFVTLSRFENGSTDLGARRLNRVAQALGLEVVLRPTSRGYTLDDLAKGVLTENEIGEARKARRGSILATISGIQYGSKKTT